MRYPANVVANNATKLYTLHFCDEYPLRALHNVTATEALDELQSWYNENIDEGIDEWDDELLHDICIDVSGAVGHIYIGAEGAEEGARRVMQVGLAYYARPYEVWVRMHKAEMPVQNPQTLAQLNR